MFKHNYVPVPQGDNDTLSAQSSSISSFSSANEHIISFSPEEQEKNFPKEYLFEEDSILILVDYLIWINNRFNFSKKLLADVAKYFPGEKLAQVNDGQILNLRLELAPKYDEEEIRYLFNRLGKKISHESKTNK